MKISVIMLGFAFAGCGDLSSDSSDVQDQQMQRSFYGTDNPARNNPLPDNTPPREPVPGEVTPDR